MVNDMPLRVDLFDGKNAYQFVWARLGGCPDAAKKVFGTYGGFWAQKVQKLDKDAHMSVVLKSLLLKEGIDLQSLCVKEDKEIINKLLK